MPNALDSNVAELLDGATSTSSQPTDGADPSEGVAIPPGTDEAKLFLASTAGSGTMEVTVRLWGYNPDVEKWFPLSIGSGAGDTSNTSGWMNGGAKIEEVGSDKLAHYELVGGLKYFSRLYAQVVAIGGTSTAVDLDAVFQRNFRGH